MEKKTNQHVPTADEVQPYAELWGKLYQTESDPEKMKGFVDDVQNFYGESRQEDKVHSLIDKAVNVVEGDKDFGNSDPKDLKELMYQTYLHESDGGKFDEQVGGGPAVGWWQVETGTAKDILENSGSYWGSKAESATGVSRTEALEKDDQQFRKFVQEPENNAVFAALQYMRSAKENHVTIDVPDSSTPSEPSESEMLQESFDSHLKTDQGNSLQDVFESHFGNKESEIFEDSGEFYIDERIDGGDDGGDGGDGGE